MPMWHVLPWSTIAAFVSLSDLYAAVDADHDVALTAGVAASALALLAALAIARPAAVQRASGSPTSLSYSHRMDSSSTLVDDAMVDSLDKVGPEVSALGQHDSVLGRMIGSALNPLFERYSSSHDIEDVATLPELPPALQPATVLRSWRDEAPPRWLGRSLAIRLAWFFRREVVRQQVFAWLRAVTQAVPPLTLKNLLDWLVARDASTPVWPGLAFAALHWLVSTATLMADVQTRSIGREMGVVLREALIGDVYSKALRTPGAPRLRGRADLRSGVGGGRQARADAGGPRPIAHHRRRLRAQRVPARHDVHLARGPGCDGAFGARNGADGRQTLLGAVLCSTLGRAGALAVRLAPLAVAEVFSSSLAFSSRSSKGALHILIGLNSAASRPGPRPYGTSASSSAATDGCSSSPSFSRRSGSSSRSQPSRLSSSGSTMPAKTSSSACSTSASRRSSNGSRSGRQSSSCVSG